MDNRLIAFIIGLVVGAGLIVLVDATRSMETTATIKTHKPIEPMGIYIKVNPGGVNDTTYVYEIKID